MKVYIESYGTRWRIVSVSTGAVLRFDIASRELALFMCRAENWIVIERT